MFASDVASGIPQAPDAVEGEVEQRRSGRGCRRAIAVGTQFDCRLKKARLSISIQPLKTSPSENAASAPATTGVWSAVNSPRW